MSVENLAHNQFFEELRSKEYARLDEQKHTYLDFTDGNSYAKSQL
jgi:molybdenum cofactor sulfurtransferase